MLEQSPDFDNNEKQHQVIFRKFRKVINYGRVLKGLQEGKSSVARLEL